MTISQWNNARLCKLFKYYNHRYWNGSLAGWTVESTTEWAGGVCFRKRRPILINVDRLADSAAIRATLLHEMAHAATNGGHGRLWQREMMRLVNAGAQGARKDLIPYKNRDPIITRGDLIREFANIAWECSWSAALASVGFANGLCSRSGEILSKEAESIIAEGKKAYQHERRKYLNYLKPGRSYWSIK